MKNLLFISWKDLTTTYSGVTLAMLAVLTYFIKRHYDLRSKKVETLHSLFQQNKITAITYFLSSYIHIDKLMQKMIVINSISITSQLEQDFISALENFRVSLMQLNLYLSPIEMNEYRRLFMNFEGICPYMEKWKYSRESAEGAQNTDILLRYLRHILLDNAKAVESIGSATRRMFHS